MCMYRIKCAKKIGGTKKVLIVGLEPTTLGLLDPRSSDWAKRARASGCMREPVAILPNLRTPTHHIYKYHILAIIKHTIHIYKTYLHVYMYYYWVLTQICLSMTPTPLAWLNLFFLLLSRVAGWVFDGCYRFPQQYVYLK